MHQSQTNGTGILGRLRALGAGRRRGDRRGGSGWRIGISGSGWASSGEAERSLEVRVLPASSLSGFVFVDENASGRFDAGTDAPIAGVEVRLTGRETVGNVPVERVTTTDAAGFYSFEGLNPGTYELTRTLPAGYAPSTISPGNPPGVVSGTLGITNIVLGQNVEGTGFDFAARAIRVSGTVFADLDRNNTRGPDEPGVPGVTVTLRTTGGVTIDTRVTDAGGNYTFDLVPIGDYVIERGPAIGYGPGTSSTLTASVGLNGLQGRDFGVTTGSLSGTVFLDLNGNGIRDPLEPGLGGTLVTLTGVDDLGNAVSRSVSTSVADGSFQFENLIGGLYTLTRETRAGTSAGVATVGTQGGEVVDGAVTDILLGGGAIGQNYVFADPGSGLGGVVFVDANRNGVLNSNERGLGGVEVILRTAGGAELRRTTTDANGSYVFEGLAAGSYLVEAVRPAGVAGGLANPRLVQLAPLSLSDGAGAASVFDVYFDLLYAEINGSVYVDANHNGIRDLGEAGIAGVEITLTGVDAAGTSVFLTTLTDGTGAYRFENLAAGLYTVTQTQPAGWLNGSTQVGSAGGVAAGDSVERIALAAGTTPFNYNFGERGTTLSGSIYVDANNNGVRDPGEIGLAGVTLELRDLEGNLAATATTDLNGDYLFRNLPTGEYRLTKSATPDFAAGSPTTLDLTLPAEGLTGRDFRALGGRLSGMVFADFNGNGVLDPGEYGIPGVTLTLRRGAGGGSLVTTTTTDANGFYSFEGLSAGTYRIVQSQPTSFSNGATLLGTLGGIVSVNEVSGINVQAGAEGTGYSFTETPFGLTGIVFNDSNRNGTFDQGERGVFGVSVRVTNTQTGVQTTVTTDVNGQFFVAGLLPGTYEVEKIQPAGTAAGSPNVVTAQIVGGAPAPFVSFANLRSQLGGVVYVDLNGNGVRDPGEPGAAGVTIRLTGVDAQNNSVNVTRTTNANGEYEFSDLLAGTYTLTREPLTGFTGGPAAPGTVNGEASGSTVGTDQIVGIGLTPGSTGAGYTFSRVAGSIEGLVFLDLNGNGVADGANGASAAEPGIPGVTVFLVNAAGDKVAEAVTGPDGIYRFAGVAPGTYSLVQRQPLIYASSTPNTINNVVVGSEGVTGRNFGETAGSLAGSVFIDANGNGRRDPNERGVPNVRVRLTGTDASGAAVDLVLFTDSEGNFRFERLGAGTYDLEQTQPALGQGAAVIGNGSGTADGPDRIANIGIGPGVALVAYGFSEAPLTNGSLSGFTFVDLNGNGVRDPGEPGIAGVTMFLTGIDEDNTPVSLTTITDANGFYSFEGLRAGVYAIRQSQPAGFLDGAETAGSLGGLTDPTPGSNAIRNIGLPGGGAGTGYDFGELSPNGSLSGWVFVDTNRDLARGPGEFGIPNVRVVLQGVDAFGVTVNRVTTTDARGFYSFEGLAPGSYQILQEQPRGFHQGWAIAGTQGGVVTRSDAIVGIALGPNQSGTENNFAERPHPRSQYRFLRQRTGAPARPPVPRPYVGPAVPKKIGDLPRFNPPPRLTRPR